MCQLLLNCRQYNIFYNIRMSNKFTQAMKERFMKDLQQINPNADDSDHDSDQSQDYFEYERKRMENALSLLKNKQNNQILNELKKNTVSEIQYIEEFNDQVADLHNITRNNKQNVLQQSVIKEIKQRVFNQSTLNTIKLSDYEIEKIKQKQQTKQKQHKVKLEQKNDPTSQIDSKLIKKLENAKLERQILSMAREDDRSLKLQNQFLSNFFAERFYTPQFKVSKNKQTSINIDNYAPKATFTNLRPLPNTQNNILPRNAPQIALRKLGKAKKIKLIPSSMSQLTIKLKKINPEEEEKYNEYNSKQMKSTKNQIQNCIENFLSLIKPMTPEIQLAGKSYRPKFVNQFPNKNEKNFNIDDQQSESKSIQDCLDADRRESIKDIKLTFEKIKNLNGINKFYNLEHASLQFNFISQLSNIEGCNKLIQLNLSHNKIKNLSAIQNMKWLKILNIQNNMINNIKLKGGSLQILYASNNRIDQIQDLSANTYLKRLKINNNKLHKLNGLNKLFLFQQIDASNNYIDTLEGIQSCILLTNLNVSNNRLVKFHPNFTYIFMNKLIASRNFMAQLPIMFLPSLQQLYLDQNKIQSQSHSLLYFPSLKVLNLDENKLSGFSVVWSLLRFSRNLQTIKYDKNQYFLDIREKVKELYEFILYKNMRNLKILNQTPYDIGIKKYYQGVYKSYLSSKSLFEPELLILEQVNKKIKFSILQNQLLSKLQDKKNKFSESNVFISHKSIMKIKDLMQIVQFLNKNQAFQILHAAKSLFYQHDKFQYNLRGSLHKIKNIIVKKEHYLLKKKKFYLTKRKQILNNMNYLKEFIRKLGIINVISIFHKPLQGLNEQKAAIIIQKNWRCFKLRRIFKKYLNRKKARKQDSDLQDIDLDQYDFDNMQIPQFNFELPQDMDFDQYIIKPEIFDMLNKQQQQSQQIMNKNTNIQNKQKDIKHSSNNHKGNQMVNNFIEQNASDVSQQIEHRKNQREQQLNRLMNHWGIGREAAMALYNKNLMKEKKKQKEKEKNLPAAQRYQNLMKKRR